MNISSIAGRVAWSGYGVYSFTKFGVNGFTESLRQELTRRHVRVGLVEPGGVATELGSHNTPEVRNEMIDPFYQQTEVLAPEDIADGIAYMITRPRHTAIGELSDQSSGLRAPRPRQRPGLPRVEELRHDHPDPGNKHHRLLQLPRPRRHRILPVLRGHPPVKREPQHPACTLPGTAARIGPLRRPSARGKIPYFRHAKPELDCALLIV